MAEGPRAFVCGHPVAHSRSPLIHGHWLARHGLPGSYERVDVAPEGFARFADTIRAGAFVGGNVTIPNKEHAFRAVDRRDTAAEAIGAVNTLWMEDGRLCGGNTDAYGFAANLDAGAPGWDRSRGVAMVVGAGGAARAVLHALRGRGFGTIRLFNRTLARATELAAAFGPTVSALPLESLSLWAQDASLLVNTSALGMDGDEAVPLDLRALPHDCLVTDIVYVPLETPLLAGARRRGLQTVDGLGMLLHQAVPGFERWFGIRPDVTPELHALVAADIARGHQ